MSFERDYEPDFLMPIKRAKKMAVEYGYFGFVIGLLCGASLSLIYFLVPIF